MIKIHLVVRISLMLKSESINLMEHILVLEAEKLYSWVQISIEVLTKVMRLMKFLT